MRRLLVIWTAVALLASALVPPTVSAVVPANDDFANATAFDSLPSDFTKPYAGVRPVKGTLPVLVVLLRSNDPRDATSLTVSQVRRDLFGPRMSVATYFNEVSYGAFNIKEAMITNWLIARDDPSTSVDEASYEYVHAGDSEQVLARKGAWLIRQAQSVFQFAPYDSNHDGLVTIDELSVFWIYPGSSGRGRPTDPATVPVSGLSKGVQLGLLARAGDQASWGTIAHELAHQIFRLADLYGLGSYPGVGDGSLMCFEGNGTHLDPWAKIKLGWLKPTVAQADGWYTLADVETSPSALILYNPLKGRQDYFIVENRWPGSSHESSLVPKGLAIWRISERSSSGEWGRKTIDLIWAGGPPPPTPGACPTKDDAFFNGADPGTAYAPTPQSAPGRLRWRDGSSSDIAVYAVQPASNSMRFYVDVPPQQRLDLVAPAVFIAGRTADLDAYEPPSFFKIPAGHHIADIVGIGIAGDDHVYVWYYDGTVTAGTNAILDDYRPAARYDLPQGRRPADIIAMDIAGDDHVYAWYGDGTVSSGTSRDLAAYRPPEPFTLPPGREIADIVGIAIAGDDHVYAWYRDGMVTSGTSRDLDAYRPAYRYDVPLGRTPDDILEVGIDTRDRVVTWLKTRGTGGPIIVTGSVDGGATALGRNANLVVKAMDSLGRPLESVMLSVSATSGKLSSLSGKTNAAGLAEFVWQAPGSVPAQYDGRALIRISATRAGGADGRALVDVPVLGSTLQ